MEQTNNLLWKSTMTSGALLGLALVIFSILLVFLDISKMGLLLILFLAIIPFIILLVGIVLGTKSYRDSVLDGQITYGHALMTGTMVVLFASIIAAFYTYIYNGLIDPSYAEKSTKVVTDKMIQFMQDWGVPDDQIEHQVSQMKSTTTPTALEAALSSIPLYTLLGFVFSLITSAFLKKEKSILDKGNPNTQQ